MLEREGCHFCYCKQNQLSLDKDGQEMHRSLSNSHTYFLVEPVAIGQGVRVLNQNRVDLNQI